MVTACDGPKEKAGAARDEAAANATGIPYDGNGPAARAGRAADRVDRANARARDSQADALEDQGRAIEAQADAQADRLEQQAKGLREAAKSKAERLEEQAMAVREQK